MPEEYLDPTDSVAVPRKAARRPPRSTARSSPCWTSPRPRATICWIVWRRLLRTRTRAKAIVRKRKPTFARPAPAAPREEIVAGTDVLVEALAD